LASAIGDRRVQRAALDGRVEGGHVDTPGVPVVYGSP
jgi:hypothetical protein